ncbi:PLDc N-terminal domain-containing protein [Curtobacterium sp. Csp1]|uniref:PLDc N-terminal domain-containing protein n=1 Tax=Curtobacterium sp. Csp1 TaxID=2495429 RepID=UPI00159976B1|nr:PLDc N-terminal domain-containing protein [Curtobacterium sp. Csp1]QKS18759.1 PLDc N-terminal domain-containing protein [Curtobacterium sp. Csp1]
MLQNMSGAHLLVIVVILALDVVALLQVWRDRRRSDVVKAVWTVVIVAVPVIGVVGWAVTWLLGRAAAALDRSR